MSREFPSPLNREFPSDLGREFPAIGGGGGGGVIPEGDPFFNQVQLLLHGEGTDGSTTFIDSSQNGFTMTRSGNTQIDTAQFKFGSASILFDGNADDLDTTADSANYTLGTSDFTIEFFIRFAVDPPNGVTYCPMSHYNNSGNQRAWLVQVIDGETLRFGYSTNGLAVSVFDASWDPDADTWYHIAVARDGSDLRMFVDGVQVGTDFDISTTNIFNSNEPLRVGAANSTGIIQSVNGWIDEVRLTVGAARYTSNFTPPSEAFPDS